MCLVVDAAGRIVSPRVAALYWGWAGTVRRDRAGAYIPYGGPQDQALSVGAGVEVLDGHVDWACGGCGLDHDFGGGLGEGLWVTRVVV